MTKTTFGKELNVHYNPNSVVTPYAKKVKN